MSKSVPVRVTSLKTGANEPEIHVMLFDMEALICHLLVEETKTQKSKLFMLSSIFGFAQSLQDCFLAIQYQPSQQLSTVYRIQLSSLRNNLRGKQLKTARPIEGTIH